MEPDEFDNPNIQWGEESFTTVEDEFGVTLPDDVLGWSINELAHWIVDQEQPED